MKLRKYESRFVTNKIDENSTPDVICLGICDLFTVLAMTERAFLLSTQKWNCNSESAPLSRLYCVRNAPLRWLLICDLFASPLTPLTTHLSPSLTLLLNTPPTPFFPCRLQMSVAFRSAFLNICLTCSFVYRFVNINIRLQLHSTFLILTPY